MVKNRLFLFLFILIILPFATAEIVFIRGDANFDGKVDLSDSIFLNNYLFKGGSPPYCMDAADSNDDGKVDISDGVYLNNYLYLGTGSPPPLPYPNAGIDPTADGLDCGPDGQGGVCQSSFCDVGIKESAEGPGGSFCACSDSKGDAGFEECYDYKKKSTATIPQFLFDPAKQATDYCKDSQTLIEVAIDCEWASQDILDFREKNCNDFNVPGPWSSYYCEDNEVKRRRNLPDYECGNGACYVGGGGYEEEILSQLGDSDYCAVKKSKCGVGCAFEEYDCDSNSECATGLVCLGPEGGAADGCCKSGQIWDTTNFQCDDCKPTDGPCCDSKGKFRPTTSVCDSNTGRVEYACKDGNCLNQDVWARGEKRYCSGTSASCSGRTEPNDPVRAEICSGSEGEYCKGSTSWSSTKPICATAQCTSGTCCNSRCGVYSYFSSNAICSGNKHEEGCPWGISLDNDAGRRQGEQRCPGNGEDCTGQITWGDWTVKQDCSTKEYCDIADSSSYCKNIACSSSSDCGTDDWLDHRFCKNNDVWDKWISWACNNAGTKSSSCSSTEQEKLKFRCDDVTTWRDEFFCKNDDIWQKGKRDVYSCSISYTCENTDTVQTDRMVEDCQNGCETLSPTSARCKGAQPPATCSDGIKNQDETDIDCGGTICGKCSNTKSCKISNDCQSNYCNPSTLKCENPPPGCTNECTTGATRCSPTNANVKQTCGNYDADACLEWGSDMNCQYGCSNNQCNAAPLPVDLTVTSLVVQWPITTPIAGQDITMAFTLKNLGTVSASGIFWKLDTGSPDPDPVNSIGLSLDAGKSITVFTRIKYVARGTYTAKAIVDYQNRIAESNEGNNEMSRSITVN